VRLLDQFEKPKIMYQGHSLECSICLDTDSMFGNNTIYFLTNRGSLDSGFVKRARFLVVLHGGPLNMAG